MFICVLCLLKLACPAERKRRAEEAQQSTMPNGVSAQNGGSTVSFLLFALSSIRYMCSPSLCGLMGNQIS